MRNSWRDYSEMNIAMKQKIINFILECALILVWFSVIGAIFYIIYPLYQVDSPFAKISTAIEINNHQGAAR